MGIRIVTWSACSYIALLLTVLHAGSAVAASPKEILEKLIAQRDSISNFVVESEWEEYWDGKPTSWEVQTVSWDNLLRRRLVYQSGKLDPSGKRILPAADASPEAVDRTDYLFDGEVVVYQQFLPNVDREGLTGTGLPLGYRRAIVSDPATSARGEIESHRNPIEYLRNTVIWDLQKRIDDDQEIVVRETQPSVYELEYTPLPEAERTDVVKSVAVVDGERGWSTTRLTVYAASDRVIAEYAFEVDAVREVWVPVSGSHRYWGDRAAGTAPMFDWRFKVTQSQVNAPDFGDAAFRLALAPDTAVSDTRYGVVYRTGANEIAAAGLTKFAQEALEEDRNLKLKPVRIVPVQSTKFVLIANVVLILLGFVVWLRRRWTKTAPLVIAFWLLWPISTFADQDFGLPENPYSLDDEKCCGPYCLLFLDSYFSGSCRIDEVMARCPPGTTGTSLSQIQEAAKGLGYHTAPFKYADIEQLRQLRFPAIIHLVKENQNGHFIVVLGPGRPGTVRGFSPPAQYGLFDAADLAKGISGVGLAVSRDPLPPIEELLRRESLWVSLLDNPLLLVLLCGLITFHLVKHVRTHSRPRGSVRKQLLLLLVLAFPLPSCTAQSGVSARDQAKLPINQFEVNLGKIQEGTVIEHEFQLVNTTDNPLKITEIKKTCSCQAVSVDQQTPIPPGGSTTVGIKFQTKGVEGPIRQRIVVVTDAQADHMREIPMSVNVDVDGGFKVVPSQIMLGQIHTKTPIQRSLQVRLTRSELANLSVTAQAENNPFLSVTLSRRVPGLVSFDLALDPSMPPGPVFGQIRFRAGKDGMKDIVVPVAGTKLGSISVVPRLLAIKANEQYPQTRTFRLTMAGERQFRLIRIDVPDGVIVHGPADDHLVRSYELEIDLDHRPDQQNPFVTLHFDRDDQATMRIPIVFDS